LTDTALLPPLVSRSGALARPWYDPHLACLRCSEERMAAWREVTRV